MNIGRFELKLNTTTLFKKEPKGSNWMVSTRDFPFVTLALRVPSLTFPIQTRNDYGEWERSLSISAPTTFQITNCSGISWEGHLIALGIGISFVWQFGY